MRRATCRRFDTIPACDGQTDGRIDGIAVANTALAIRVLRRAVKSTWYSIACGLRWPISATVATSVMFLSRDPDFQTRDPDFVTRNPELQSRDPDVALMGGLP